MKQVSFDYKQLQEAMSLCRANGIVNLTQFHEFMERWNCKNAEDVIKALKEERARRCKDGGRI